MQAAAIAAQQDETEAPSLDGKTPASGLLLACCRGFVGLRAPAPGRAVGCHHGNKVAYG